MLLAELTWAEVEEYLRRDDRLILPLGSTEQHGRHLPLHSDAFIACAIAKEIGEATDVLVAPVVPYGVSGNHMAFPGTVSLTPSLFEELILEILRSLYQHGFQRIFIVNGHGGNIPSVQNAVITLLSLGVTIAVQIRSWHLEPEVKELLAEFSPPGGHAGPAETSLSLVFHSEKVKLQQAQPGPQRRLQSLMLSLTPKGQRQAYPHGNTGADPTLASREFGERILERVVSLYVQEIQRWESPQ
jgi:creatinine amidohydrolase